jgi:hypothetical protein
MKTPLTLGLAGALALTGAVPALAQNPGSSSYQYGGGQYDNSQYGTSQYDNSQSAAGTPYQPTEQYQRDLQRYDRDRADYQARRMDYAQAKRDYDRQRSDYEAARARYDARWGYGAYARRYGPPPVWDEARWAGSYGSDAAYTGSVDACRDRQSGNTVAGGLIGALAGAALGSNVAAHNARTEGAVLGAVVGGAVGAGIGHASTPKCDPRGYYFSYSDTIPYRESVYDMRRRSGRHDYSYYVRERCRLAPAPVDWGDHTEYRYVRVCPDAEGRYRLTG